MFQEKRAWTGSGDRGGSCFRGSGEVCGVGDPSVVFAAPALQIAGFFDGAPAFDLASCGRRGRFRSRCCVGALRRVGVRIFERDAVEDRNVTRPGERAVAQREVERGAVRGDGDDEAPGSGPRRTPRGPGHGWRQQPGTAFPQGSVAPEARAGSDPRHGREECDKHSPPVQFLDKERGVALSPTLRPAKESGIRRYSNKSQRGQRVL